MRSTEPNGGPERPRYQVSLPAFEGPLELLLSLIESQQLEITAISLAAVADQYLAHLRTLPELDPEELAGFVEVAARLLVIKSRALLPAPPSEVDEEDVAGDLIERLQEYRRFRHASQWLAERLQSGVEQYGREPSLPSAAPGASLRPMLPILLLQAAIRLLSPIITPPEEPDEYLGEAGVSIFSRLKLVLRRLAHQAVVFFADLISGARNRSEVAVTFLAVLELVRRGRVRATQTELFGPIAISAAAPDRTNAPGRTRTPDREGATTPPDGPPPPVEQLEQVC
ncbi:MAG: segregation and condensation protein A [Anaerolineae bacterium]